MRGRPPKAPALRRGHGAATGSKPAKSPSKSAKSATKAVAPRLPGKLHPRAKAWWRQLWASDLAPMLGELDVEPLVALAMLFSDFHRAESPRERVAAFTAFRLGCEAHGLNVRSRPSMAPAAERASRKIERATPTPAENAYAGLLEGRDTDA